MASDRGRPQGGDVSGTTRIDVTQGDALPVASASFDPGYDYDASIAGGDPSERMSRADIVQGYCSYGKLIGESRK